MPYTIDSYDGTTFTFNISDGTVDSTNTSLKLLGQNYRGYGEIVAEDFLHLLENFSKTTAPSNPIHGQIWYDKSTGSGAANKGYKLKFYDDASSSWKMVANLASGAGNRRHGILEYFDLDLSGCHQLPTWPVADNSSNIHLASF